MSSPSRIVRIAMALLVAAGTAACSTGGAPSVSVAPEPSSPVAGPTLDLTLAAATDGAWIADAGDYASDPASNMRQCTETREGFWRVLYAGGEPWMSVDVLVGAAAVAAGHSEAVTAEIAIGSSTYLWIDQPQIRGGDAVGRSQAIVDVLDGPDAITFDLSATSPLRTPAGDGTPIDVHLKVVCPRG